MGILDASWSQLMNSLLWLVIFIGRMIGAAVTGKVSRNKLLLLDGVGFFACFLVMFFSRTPAPIILGLVGVGLFMATIYPTAFAFGSDCIPSGDIPDSPALPGSDSTVFSYWISPSVNLLCFRARPYFLRAFVNYWFDVSNERAGWNGKCVLVQPIAPGAPCPPGCQPARPPAPPGRG